MELNELLSGMFISGVTADAAFYSDCARQQMPRRLKDRAISFNAKKRWTVRVSSKWPELRTTQFEPLFAPFRLRLVNMIIMQC